MDMLGHFVFLPNGTNGAFVQGGRDVTPIDRSTVQSDLDH